MGVGGNNIYCNTLVEEQIKMKKNYGVMPLIVGIGLFLLMLPIALFGLAASIKAISFMFSPVSSTGIPIWALLIGLIVILMLFKRRRTNPYIV